MDSTSVNWVPGVTLEELEKQAILVAFRFYRGNKTQTSISLGIAIRTLEHKMEKYQDDAKRLQDSLDADEIERARTLDRLRGVEFTRQNQVGHQPKPYVHTPDMLQTAAGIRVESAKDSTSKHEMPLPKQKEIQSMLPRQASGSSNRKGR